jgi:hypothetical protein
VIVKTNSLEIEMKALRFGTVLGLGLLLGAVACSSSSDDGQGESTKPRTEIPSGKTDNPSPEDCAGTAFDSNGVCRDAGGRFAPKACCVSQQKCQNAAFNSAGQCYDPASGEFVQKDCCQENLCSNAKLDASGYCRGTDGRFAFRACCADECYKLQPPSAATAPSGSCQNACGDIGSGECFCDDVCVKYGDCCADFASECNYELPQGCNIPIDECANAEWDPTAERCRDSVTGKFALSACCTHQCENADLQADSSGHWHCRNTVDGKFMPMACCQVDVTGCAGAFLDSTGYCHKTNGQFADPACCAYCTAGAKLDASGKCVNPNPADASNPYPAHPDCCSDECYGLEQTGQSLANTDGCNGAQQAPQINQN